MRRPGAGPREEKTMTTAVSETVKEVEVLRQQAQATRRVVHLNVDGLTQEESLVQPAPGGSCLNWVVGHLVATYNQMLPLLGQKPVLEEGALKRYARGTPPLENPAEALDLQVLLTAWDDANDRVDAGLASLTSDALDKPVSISPTKNPNETVRSLLPTILFHQAYHAGQTGLLRRIAGKPGAIA
jgi:uncharacterized damage-inducible protein DinB